MAKQRNGPIGTVYLKFNATHTTFAAMAARPTVMIRDEARTAFRRDIEDRDALPDD